MLASSAFKEKLREAQSRTGTNLCLGIDPSPEALPAFASSEMQRLGPTRFLGDYARTLLAAAAPHLPAVKFQSAFFEAFGAAGFAALTEAMHAARGLGLVTILDAKRGDIASTMAAYG